MSWQWRMMQKLKRNWLVSSKLTWGIWQILTQALENLKNLHFNGLLKYMFELKKYKGIMFDGTDIDTKFEGKTTCAFKMTWGIQQIFTTACLKV